MASSISPNCTLYINNLNDKINKNELKAQLFALFVTYGRVIDVVAQKGEKRKGQAFLVFAELAQATAAMRACEGMLFYDKPLHIQYAKSKSYATMKKEDPDFIPPNPVASQAASRSLNGVGEKRSREEDDFAGASRQSKREKSEEEDEEMELDDDEQEQGRKKKPTVPSAVQQPSQRLICTNLPQEVTDDVLSVLFQQYRGFLAAQTAQAPNTTADGQKTKLAQVFFESSELASVAKEALDGFALKKGWNMSVAYF